MFRFNRPKSEAPAPAETRTLISAEAMDPTRVLGELLSRTSIEGLLEGALAHAATILGGTVKGYAVLRRGQDQVVAVHGYPKTLVGLSLAGPWAQMRPRILTDGSKELYEKNPSSVYAQLDAAGMREVQSSVVVPLTDKGRTLGALMLDRSSAGAITPQQQEAVNRWAAVVTPLLGVFETRDEWRQAARQITTALVEAVESQDFDALGHAQQVAEISQQLGRSVGLSERDLEQLWYGAVLHDIGKINGEAGHASIGANFLHGAPMLAEAQKAIRHHHEHWDGTGEPEKLAGEDIPLYARIVAVANAVAHNQDPTQLRAQAGKTLDPRIVDLALKLPPR
ncbi:HD domain-containing phosphohydrolase [Deinococcus lacus]|uniref:HD domain-containing phosphohydrolase n=1 Tax=Deinococcus lacus TaxID=392561 RepID=A0ABW1Y9T1_9DEIO